MRRPYPALAVVVLALALAACDRNTSHGSGLQVLSPGQLPTGSPAGATGNVDRGAATVMVTGDVDVSSSIDQLQGPAVYSAAPGGMALEWNDVQHGPDALALSGPTFKGSLSTSAELRLQITVGSPVGTLTFDSQAGECRITVAKSDAHTFDGSFTCSALKDMGGHTVDANGTFAASG